MKNIIIIIVVVFLLINCAVFQQIRAIKNLEYEYKGLNIAMTSLGKFALLVDVYVRNPNNVDIEIVKMEYDIKINNVDIASGETLEKLKIKKKSDGIYHTKIDIKTKNIKKSFKEIINQREMNIKLKGFIRFKTYFGTYSMPFYLEK